MSLWLLLVIALLFVIAMVVTFYAFKQEEQKMKRYEEEGDTVEDELRRSHEYEANSVQKYLPIQIWLYVITAVATVVIVGYFLI
ncbi:hypothetical protein ACLIBG_02455 [Virgibacillus sp. W0181]|uniref:hypothetical protein n=1 Tax=Virgibacillus sp. W0181 TaxID=3391581 RepID=UPI003F462F31